MGDNEDRAKAMVAWLREQAQADRERAAAATPGPWKFEGDDPADDELFTIHDGEHGDLVGDVVAYVRGGERTQANGQHMELHDPPTEAARAESVLAVIAEYEAAAAKKAAMDEPEHDWAPPHVNASVRALALAVRLLASGYRHRDGYREAWKP